MRALSSSNIALAFLCLAAAPAACIFPSYTFDRPDGTGGAAGSVSSSSTRSASSSTSTMTTTSSTGGSTTTSTTSTTSTGGSGGTGGTGGIGGSTTASTAMASSSSGMPEDCLNGVDDNGDSKVDCADPLCAQKTKCVSTIPMGGWTGPVAIFEGANDPGCPAEYPNSVLLGNSGLVPESAQCTCKCDAAKGGTCQMADQFPDDPMVPYTIGLNSIWLADAPCNTQSVFIGVFDDPASWTGTCTTNNGGFAGGTVTCGAQMNAPCNVAVYAGAPVVVGSSCNAQPVVTKKPSPNWANVGRACGGPVMTAMGCNAGTSCLPKPQAPYVQGVCIQHDGIMPGCPPGFPDQHVFYQGVTDTRGCMNDCTCGGVNGESCAIDVTVYSDQFMNTCNTALVTFPAGSCAALNGNPAVAGRKYTVKTLPNGGTCTGLGGTPTGSIVEDAATATTFCCTN